MALLILNSFRWSKSALSPGARSVRELGEVILQAQTMQFSRRSPVEVLQNNCGIGCEAWAPQIDKVVCLIVIVECETRYLVSLSIVAFSMYLLTCAAPWTSAQLLSCCTMLFQFGTCAVLVT